MSVNYLTRIRCRITHHRTAWWEWIPRGPHRYKCLRCGDVITGFGRRYRHGENRP